MHPDFVPAVADMVVAQIMSAGQRGKVNAKKRDKAALQALARLEVVSPTHPSIGKLKQMIRRLRS